MSYFTSLVTRGQSKADAIKAAITNTSSSVGNSKLVVAAGNMADKALVNTIGVTAAFVAPTVTKVWTKLEDWSKPAVVKS